MGWSLWLHDDRGHCEGDWDYTYNTGRMAHESLERARPGMTDDPDFRWYRAVAGSSGPEGGAIIADMVRELEADPDYFRTLNPPNGWGDYDSFVKVLRNMRDRVPEWPCVWSGSF